MTMLSNSLAMGRFSMFWIEFIILAELLASVTDITRSEKFTKYLAYFRFWKSLRSSHNCCNTNDCQVLVTF